MAEPRRHVALLYHFCRLRLPRLTLPQATFRRQLEAAFARLHDRAEAPLTDWSAFVAQLHALDWFLACACLHGLPAAWETLFASRVQRSEALLIDALRQRAARLFPRDPERQEEAVMDFWGYLLAGHRDGSAAILARYDGLRPLVPWLIRVFQNKVLSELRGRRGEVALPDDELCEAEPPLPEDADARWHEQFREAARDWLADLTDAELLLLGLRLRYKLSQREVARVLGIHEGNVTRRIDTLSERCHERIGGQLRELGWTGDDLYGFVRKEMYSVLLDDPRLAAERLASMLAARGAVLPAEAGSTESAAPPRGDRGE